VACDVTGARLSPLLTFIAISLGESLRTGLLVQMFWRAFACPGGNCGQTCSYTVASIVEQESLVLSSLLPCTTAIVTACAIAVILHVHTV